MSISKFINPACEEIDVVDDDDDQILEQIIKTHIESMTQDYETDEEERVIIHQLEHWRLSQSYSDCSCVKSKRENDDSEIILVYRSLEQVLKTCDTCGRLFLIR